MTLASHKAENNYLLLRSALLQVTVTVYVFQVCSEYSAHRYDFEKTGNTRSIPGLCEDYCHDIFDRCRVAIARLTDDRKLLNLIQNNSKQEFCDEVKLPTDSYYCFPPKDEYEAGVGNVLEFFEVPRESMTFGEIP